MDVTLVLGTLKRMEWCKICPRSFGGNIKVLSYYRYMLRTKMTKKSKSSILGYIVSELCWIVSTCNYTFCQIFATSPLPVALLMESESSWNIWILNSTQVTISAISRFYLPWTQTYRREDENDVQIFGHSKTFLAFYRDKCANQLTNYRR